MQIGAGHGPASVPDARKGERIMAMLAAANVDPDTMRAMRDARLALELIDDPESADGAAEALLGWIQALNEEP